MNNTSLNRANYKLKVACRTQYQIAWNCLDDLIPEDHKVRTLWQFAQNMDFSVCYEEINSFQGDTGRAAIDPKILFVLWVYTIMDGNSSARKLEELCENHNVYKWVCGGVSVSRTILAEFRSKNPRKFDELLTTSLAVLVKNGLISDTDFSQDGTRVKANAGFASFHREESLNKIEAEIKKYIESLNKEDVSHLSAFDKNKLEKNKRIAVDKKNSVEKALRNLYEARCEKKTNGERNRNEVTEEDLNKVRASTTDPQVRKMKMGDGGFRLAHNVQFATGLDSRVIYGVDVVNTLDPGTAPRLMYQVQERLKKLSMKTLKKWIADSAYSGKNDIITTASLFSEVLYYAPPKPKKGENPKKHRKEDCEAVKKWRDLIGSNEVNELYKKRCSTAEFSNMHVKNHAFQEFSLRGLVKAKAEATLNAISMNISRFINLFEAQQEPKWA